MVQALGEASYEARTNATLRLIGVGSEARPELEKAAAGADVEQALRAKRILQIFDSLYFLDTEIVIGFSQSSTRWDEPVSINFTFNNQGASPTRIPFELDAKKREALGAEAMQVADMLDAAEWLHVFAPSGAEVALRVDDIAKDERVVQVVEERLSGGPASTINPQSRAGLAIKDFNRGWARFPLLETGEYTAFLEYVPAWNDESLAKARVGVARSNTTTITVQEAAPPAVSRSGVEAEVAVERSGDELIARLINHSDVPVFVNTNFGMSTPLANATWIIEQGERRVEVPLNPGGSWRDFNGDNLVEVKAGDSIELARASLDSLKKEASRLSLDLIAATVSFTYSNFCDASWQSREGKSFGGGEAPAALKKPLPHRMLTTRQTSPAVPAN
jgi:hypothetical protein